MTILDRLGLDIEPKRDMSPADAGPLSWQALMKRLRLLLEPIVRRLQGVPGVQLEITEMPPGGYPAIKVKVDKSRLGRSAVEVVQRLKDSQPPIYVFAKHVSAGEFIINPCSLDEGQADIIAECLYKAITG